VLGATLAVPVMGPAGAAPLRWVERFEEGRLEPARWVRTLAGDVRDWSVEVTDAPRSGGFRVRVAVDTRGTRDDSVKRLGVRSTCPIPLGADTRIAVELDWNAQVNGSYLSAGIVLAPHATREDPLATPDWISVQYVGVPPGRRARMVVALSEAGRQRTIYTEGWPDVNRAGRPIAVHDVAVHLGPARFEVLEDGKAVTTAAMPATHAMFLYLQMSSHSNYPWRAVLFGNVRIEAQASAPDGWPACNERLTPGR